jgi:hypothetical protein
MKKLASVFFLFYLCVFFAPSMMAMTSVSVVQDERSISQVMKEKLVKFVSHTINNLKYTAYKFGGNHFDASKGVYVLDCSAYVDKVLESIHPDAYFDLVDTLGTDRPTSHDYYTFFKSLPEDGSDSWNAVKTVEELEAGDILVFRYKNKKGKITGGHVMVVMDAPIGDADTYSVRVADSAPTQHSQDTRYKQSGIGIGTLSIKVNPSTGQPYAFAWRTGAKWMRNVSIAMARPIVSS